MVEDKDLITKILRAIETREKDLVSIVDEFTNGELQVYCVDEKDLHYRDNLYDKDLSEEEFLVRFAEIVISNYEPRN